MSGAVCLEALPVIRKLPRKEDLPAQPTGPRVGAPRARLVQLASLVGAEIRCERLSKRGQEIGRQRVEFVPIVAAIALRRGSAVPLV